MTFCQDMAAQFLFNASLLYRETCPELARFLLQQPNRSETFSSLLQSTFVCQYCFQWLKPGDVRVRLRPKRRPSALVRSVLLRRARGKRLSVLQKKLLVRFQKSSSVLSIGQSFEPHPRANPGGSCSGSGQYKAGHAGLRVTLKEAVPELCGPTPLTDTLQFSVRNFKMATFISMATCHACSQTSRYQGANRDFLSTLSKNYSTPGSAGKYKTPQSSSRSSRSISKTPGRDKTPAQTPRSSISSTVSVTSSTSSKSSSKPKNWVFQRLSKILTRDENQESKKGGLKDFLSSL